MTPLDNHNWSSPFALSCFHKMSSLLRTCPPLLLLIGYFQPCSLCYLYFFTRFTFVHPGAPTDAFTYSCCLAIAGSPVSLFSLCKCLAFSITYTMQPVAVFIRCTLSQRVTERCFRCKWSRFRYLLEGSLAFNSLTRTQPPTFSTSLIGAKHLSVVC